MYPFLDQRSQTAIDERQRERDEETRRTLEFEGLDRRANQTFGDIKPYDFSGGWYAQDPLNPDAFYTGTPQTDAERRFVMDYMDRYGVKPNVQQVTQALNNRPYEERMKDAYAPGTTMYQLGYDTAGQYFSTPGQGAGPAYAERQQPIAALPKWQQPQYQEMPFDQAVKSAEPAEIYRYKVRDYVSSIQGNDSQILSQLREVLRNPQYKGQDVSSLVNQLSPVAKDYISTLTGEKIIPREVMTDEQGNPKINQKTGEFEYKPAQTIKDYLFDDNLNVRWDYVDPGQLYFNDANDYYNDLIKAVDNSAKSGVLDVPYKDIIDQSPAGQMLKSWYEQFKNTKFNEFQSALPKQKADWQKQVYKPAYQNYLTQMQAQINQGANVGQAINQNPAQEYQSWVMGSGYADSVKSWLLGNYDSLLAAWDRSMPFMNWVMQYLTTGGR